MVSIRVSIITAVFFTMIAANASAAIYKWKDDAGQIHYGSMPPQGVSAQKMGVSTFTPPPPAAKSPSASKSPTNSEQASTGKAEEKDTYTKEQHDTVCKNARKDLETLNTGNRLRVKQEDGSTKVLSDKEKSERMKTMQDMVKKHCK